ncbi:MAG: hypothetical protein H6702_05180 [Myxococcales bacterium]|nr:hypothetical protein [Myxococcales bacterium]
MRALAATAVTLSLCACQGPASEPEPPTVDGGRAGLVTLTHTYGEPGVAVSGQVMACYGQPPAQALHALAQAEQAWMLEPPPPLGTCQLRWVQGEAAHRASIDLLDVGPLTVTPPAPLSDQPITVAPRALPAFDFRVTGVVYDADRPEELPYLAGGQYRVAARGADVAEPLRASVQAPEPVALEAIEVDGEGLQIIWRTAGQVRVLLARDAGADTVGLDCHGQGATLTVPAEDLRALGDGPVQISVQRATLAPGEPPVMFVTRDVREHVIDLSLWTEAPR